MTAIEKDRLDIMEEKFDKLEDKVDKILIALIGDELQISEGLIANQKKQDIRISALEKVKNKFIWMSMGAGITGGIGLSKLFDLLKEVFK